MWRAPHGRRPDARVSFMLHLLTPPPQDHDPTQEYPQTHWYAFVDLLHQANSAGSSWMFDNIRALNAGQFPYFMRPREQFDALLYERDDLDEVPPLLLAAALDRSSRSIRDCDNFPRAAAAYLVSRLELAPPQQTGPMPMKQSSGMSRRSARRCCVAVLALCVAALSTGCASFTNVRSAQVKDGVAFSTQLSKSAELGDEAGYMWASGQLDSCNPCSRRVYSIDTSLRRGFADPNSTRAYELGIGTTGVMQLYGEAFAGWNQHGRVPFGVGARATALTASANHAGRDYRVDGRLDLRLNSEVRVLFGYGLFYHRTSQGSWLLAQTPGTGLEASYGPVTLSSSIGWLHGHGRRADAVAAELGLQDVSVAAVPIVVVGVTLHGRNAVRPIQPAGRQ